MPQKSTGTVASWNMPNRAKKSAEGYGFVSVDGEEGEQGLFLYADYITNAKLRSEAKLWGLKAGTRIQFEIQEPKSERHRSRLAVNCEPMRGGAGGGGGGGGRSRSRRRSPTPQKRRSPSV